MILVQLSNLKVNCKSKYKIKKKNNYTHNPRDTCSIINTFLLKQRFLKQTNNLKIIENNLKLIDSTEDFGQENRRLIH